MSWYEYPEEKKGSYYAFNNFFRKNFKKIFNHGKWELSQYESQDINRNWEKKLRVFLHRSIYRHLLHFSIIIGHRFTFVHNLVHMKTLKFICKSIPRKKVNLLKECRRIQHARTMEKPHIHPDIGYTLGSRKFKHRSSSMADKTHSPSFLFTVTNQCRILF